MRLIDADKVKAMLKPYEKSDESWTCTGGTAIRLIHNAIDNAPTVDAVPVVQCRTDLGIRGRATIATMGGARANLRMCAIAIWMEATRMDDDRRRALVDGLLIAASVVALIVIILVAIRVYAWPLWIKLVDWLPIPGQLKMWLWGWF